MKGQVWKEITIKVPSGHGSSPRGGAFVAATLHSFNIFNPARKCGVFSCP